MSGGERGGGSSVQDKKLPLEWGKEKFLTQRIQLHKLPSGPYLTSVFFPLTVSVISTTTVYILKLLEKKENIRAVITTAEAFPIDINHKKQAVSELIERKKALDQTQRKRAQKRRETRI
ncbi:hypothetical protein Nmel_015340 [Mimus melanotis]